MPSTSRSRCCGTPSCAASRWWWPTTARAGVVTTASYAARKFGVHSALPMVTARRRCPELTVLPVDMQLYRRGSVKVMETLREYSDTVEVVGMDEAYVDLSASPVPQSRAREIKRKIKEATAPGLLDRPGAEQADGEDRLGPRQARRALRARTRRTGCETVGEKPASLLPGVGPSHLRAPARDRDRDRRRARRGRAGAPGADLRPAARPRPAGAGQRRRRAAP